MIMEPLNFCLVIAVVFTAIPTLHTLSYDECSSRTQTCLLQFTSVNRGSRNLCQDAQRTMQCVRNLECPSMMYKIMTHRRVSNDLYTAGVLRCDLGNFLEDFPNECANAAKLRNCLVIYTDRVTANTRSRDFNKADVCDDLTDYANCQLGWDSLPCLDRNDLREFVRVEKERNGLNDCDISIPNGASLAGSASILAVTLTSLVSLLLARIVGRV